MTDFSDIPQNVVDEFEKMANVIREKRERYSARTILHVMRWHRDIRTGEQRYKLNDHWTPVLARWFMKKHKCPGYFETRNSPGGNLKIDLFE